MKGLTKEYMNQIEISLSLFEYWGLWTNQNKIFKSHLEGTEAAVYCGHKEFFIRSKG